MKLFNRWIMVICSLLIANNTFALPNGAPNVLKLTIKNNSPEILHYTGVTHTSLGSVFIINATAIFPGGEALVTCTSSPYYDLMGQLHFNDAAGNGNLLTIIDRRLMHFSPPTFSMLNNQFVSFVESKKFNAEDSNNPRALSYIEAKVIIEKNPAAPHTNKS